MDWIKPNLDISCVLCKFSRITPLPMFSASLPLLPVDLLEDLENLDEEVDNVEVQLDGGHDVLLRVQPFHDHLNTCKHERQRKRKIEKRIESILYERQKEKRERER